MLNEILSNSMEDYLEAISKLQREKNYVRVKDIAKEMKVRMPSVTGALKALTDRNLVRHEKYEYVELTEDGIKIADEIKRRHDLISKFLTHILKIDQEIAEKDACKIEHSVSQITMERLVKLVEYMGTCPEKELRCLIRD
jgi:DtxR family Mn-dependent transcriptional regulator